MKVVIDKDIEDLVIRFIEKRKEDRSVLRELHENADFKGLMSIGHRISGTAASYGFKAISIVASGIDKAAKAENLDTLKILIDKYDELIEKTSYECEE